MIFISCSWFFTFLNGGCLYIVHGGLLGKDGAILPNQHYLKMHWAGVIDLISYPQQWRSPRAQYNEPGFLTPPIIIMGFGFRGYRAGYLQAG